VWGRSESELRADKLPLGALGFAVGGTLTVVGFFVGTMGLGHGKTPKNQLHACRLLTRGNATSPARQIAYNETWHPSK
jgi:hypothetical protein